MSFVQDYIARGILSRQYYRHLFFCTCGHISSGIMSRAPSQPLTRAGKQAIVFVLGKTFQISIIFASKSAAFLSLTRKCWTSMKKRSKDKRSSLLCHRVMDEWMSFTTLTPAGRFRKSGGWHLHGHHLERAGADFISSRPLWQNKLACFNIENTFGWVLSLWGLHLKCWRWIKNSFVPFYDQMLFISLRASLQKGQGKIMAPLFANVNVLSAFCHLPACWYHTNVTLGRKAESTLRKVESGAVNLPGPLAK